MVRALKRSDADEWQAVRARNHDWLRPWDATVPPGAAPRPSSYRVVTRSLLHQAKLGLCLPFVIEVGGRFVGQVTVSNVARGSAQWGQLRCTLDQADTQAGRLQLAAASEDLLELCDRLTEACERSVAVLLGG